jgi:hypothetical protein
MNKSNRKNKSYPNKIVCRASFIVCLMILSGAIGYFVSIEEIQGSYDKITIITNDREGIGLEEMSRTFLPDLNIKIGIKLIKAANGYVSDDITFLKGQRVKIPSKDSAKLWVTDRVLMTNH